MLSDTDFQALVDAAMKRLTIEISYIKKDSGENVYHTGGVTKIDAASGTMYLWDTGLNDHTRRFYLANIVSLQVLAIPFDNISAGGYPLEINGAIIQGV